MNREILEAVLRPEDILTDEPMKKHTTFRTGGNADFYVTPRSEEELLAVIRLCREKGCCYYLIGNGSNLLVGDRGFRGVIIQLFRNMDGIRAEGTRMHIQAGTLLSAAAAKAQEMGLAGLEFASGIPGTFGGAVVMNAGAYGGEMKDVIREVRVLTPEGEFLMLSNEDMEMGYRTSVAAEKGYIILEGVIELEPGEQDAIRMRMEELKKKRVAKQPLEYPSAGSTFKRPKGYFAGKLIDDAGLRGFQVGGAQVSEKHCGFVINKECAASADILELMRRVQEKVKADFGVSLEPEVKRIGEF